jgi:hypothetical protein
MVSNLDIGRASDLLIRGSVGVAEDATGPEAASIQLAYQG